MQIPPRNHRGRKLNVLRSCLTRFLNFGQGDRKSTRLNSSHANISYAVFCLKKKEYEYRQEGSFNLMNLPKGRRYGLISEDLEQIFPNLIKATKFDTLMDKPHGKK